MNQPPFYNNAQQPMQPPQFPPAGAQNGPYTRPMAPPPGSFARPPGPPTTQTPVYSQYNNVNNPPVGAPMSSPDTIPRNNSAPHMLPPSSSPSIRPPPQMPASSSSPYVNGATTTTTTPHVNGPGAPPPPRMLGPHGQAMNRSVSSPPATGPIAMAPIPGQPPASAAQQPPSQVSYCGCRLKFGSI